MPFHAVYCEDTGETITSYADYLQSEHWRKIKDWFYHTRARKHCYICRNRDRLNLHHKTYKNLGKEKWIDLVYLCERCHHYCHKLIRAENIKGSIWGVTKHIRKQYEAGMITLEEENPVWGRNPTKHDMGKRKSRKRREKIRTRIKAQQKARILVLKCRRCGETYSTADGSTLCPSCEK